VVLVSGCWKLDAAELSADRVDFAPESAAPEGWVVESVTINQLKCPDGVASKFYLVYPKEADLRQHPDAAAVPLALVFHSGSFDYIYPQAVRPPDPLAGESFTGDKRLTSDWAFKRVFTTLGMYPDDDPIEEHTGALPAELANQGIAMMLPANCWGDWWHNRVGAAENVFALDGFFRNGRAMAEFSWNYAIGFRPDGRPAELPILIDTSRTYMIGLGEGGRAVGELFTYDLGATDAIRPQGILIDSVVDDLRPYYKDALYADTKQGLDHLFPLGETSVRSGQFGWVPIRYFPQNTGYLYSNGDTRIPAGAHIKYIDYLRPNIMAQRPELDSWVWQDIVTEHVLLNANPTLAEAAVSFMVGGFDALDPAYTTGPGATAP
jgi:hypothetical protein